MAGEGSAEILLVRFRFVPSYFLHNCGYVNLPNHSGSQDFLGAIFFI